jgi:NAD(P)-dependent dehydrogenase (short-subunit alcohol dehydrogenase family)
VQVRKELARPEEIAPSVIFVASDVAAWVTGERTYALGGVR